MQHDIQRMRCQQHSTSPRGNPILQLVFEHQSARLESGALRLAEVRKHATQQDLAEMLGVSQSRVSQIERQSVQRHSAPASASSPTLYKTAIPQAEDAYAEHLRIEGKK